MVGLKEQTPGYSQKQDSGNIINIYQFWKSNRILGKIIICHQYSNWIFFKFPNWRFWNFYNSFLKEGLNQNLMSYYHIFLGSGFHNLNYLEMKKISFQIPGFYVAKYLNWKLSSFLKFLFLLKWRKKNYSEREILVDTWTCSLKRFFL